MSIHSAKDYFRKADKCEDCDGLSLPLFIMLPFLILIGLLFLLW